MGSSEETFEAEYRALERALDRELWVVTATDGTHKGGLIATFVNTASIVPTMPRVVVGLSHRHRTWELVETSGAFALHLLPEEHLDWVVRFGLQSSRASDKFAGLNHAPGRSGSPILTDAAGWLDCRVEARRETGDRTIYLAEVVDARAPRVSPVLTVQRMLRLVPESIRARLAEDRDRDALADAEAIRRWREGDRVD